MSADVLFVESTRGMADRFVHAFYGLGLHVVAVPSERAVAAVEERIEAPILVVIEREAGDMDYRVARALRACTRLSGVPFLLLSPPLTPSERVRAARAGCAQVLETPVTPDEMAVALETLFEPSARRTVRPKPDVA